MKKLVSFTVDEEPYTKLRERCKLNLIPLSAKINLMIIEEVAKNER